MIFAVAARRVRAAKFPEDLFGEVAAEVNEAYRELAKVLHPDVHRGKNADKARVLFLVLGGFKATADEAIEGGTYGQRKPPIAAPPKPSPVVIEVKGGVRFILGDKLSGELCDVYKATRSDKAGEHPAAFKVARSPADNDLVKAEAEALKKLRPKGSKEEGHYRYFTPLLDSFEVASAGTRRRANVMPWIDGHCSLAEVKKAYPGGLDFRDAAWMFRRTLSALGFAHRQGIVHGAVIPEHVLICPETHGAKLVDWCYSVELGRPLKAYVAARKATYPPEVFRKEPFTSSADIFMAARTIFGLLKPDTPAEVIRFLRGCVLMVPKARPQDAFALNEEFAALLAELVGPRKFRPFEMP